MATKTQGEIEALVCEGMTRFQQDYMGRGPKQIRAHLIGDVLLVRLHGVLTLAEQQLVKALAAEKGAICSSKFALIWWKPLARCWRRWLRRQRAWAW